MRRRRSKMKALKKFRIQGQIFVYWMLVFSSYILCEPGYLDFDNLPETNFTCAGKVIGGYYADLETSCQMFHVCTIGQLDEPMDIKFLCLNGTVFDQETRVCERVDEVDCTKSEKFYYLNLELYGNTMLPLHEEESSQETFSSQTRSTNAPTTVSTTTAKAPMPKPVPTISSSDNKLNKDYNKPNSYAQSHPSHPSLQTPIAYNLTTTQKPFEDDDVEEDYEYEDDFYTTDGKESQNYQSQSEFINSQNASTSSYKLASVTTTGKPMTTIKSNSGNDHSDFSQTIFSPQQFILNQNHAKQSAQSLAKLEPISFQQQKFQNGGTLTVTNSHVMPSSTTTTPSPSSDLSYLQSFRVQGQGFRLPSVHLANNYDQQQHILQQQQHELLQKQLSPVPQSFEGYRKQQKPQIALRLPIEENRPHFDSLDEIYPSDDHKDLKQAEIHPQSRRTTHIISAQDALNYGFKNTAVNNERNHNHSNNSSRNSNGKSTTYNAYNAQSHQDDYPNQNYRQFQHSQHQHQQQQQHQHQQRLQQSNQRGEASNTNYDKILLTPQDQYIKTLPKVIITASASVTDATGKKLNYSVGTVKLPPAYDEYREDDVSLDPFFLDVPKLLPRNKRNVAS